MEVFKKQAELKKMVETIGANTNLLRAQPRQAFIETASSAMMYAALAIKHGGFSEEREWRILCLPTSNDAARPAETVVETIRGIPQQVYKLPLAGPPAGQTPTEAAHWAMEYALSHILVGPSLYPALVEQAFQLQLAELGILEPVARVKTSDTPLRQWR